MDVNLLTTIGTMMNLETDGDALVSVKTAECTRTVSSLTKLLRLVGLDDETSSTMTCVLGAWMMSE